MVKLMKGLTLATIKKQPNLIPLFTCVVVGMAGAGYYLLRLAIRCPDVSWNKRDEVLPWNKLPPTYQYKFYSPTRDYAKEKISS